jgi:hypothetical protein
MIGHRHLFGLGIFAFATGFVFAIGGMVAGATAFSMLGVPLFYIGVLAAWLGRMTKEQSERLDRIEATLQSR